MRHRNIKGARELLQKHEKVINNPLDYKGKWKEVFNNNNPIYIEIGMGKGKFISEISLGNPLNNYIGFEKYSNILARALYKIDEVDSENIRVVRMNVEDILEVFDSGEISRIYLNFSDPWPKDRHAKRRLTHKHFLDMYDIILDKNGEVHLKTDNKGLFNFSVEQFKENGWSLKKISYDIHKEHKDFHNIMTEYEEKFVELGLPICRLEAYR